MKRICLFIVMALVLFMVLFCLTGCEDETQIEQLDSVVNNTSKKEKNIVNENKTEDNINKVIEEPSIEETNTQIENTIVDDADDEKELITEPEDVAEAQKDVEEKTTFKVGNFEYNYGKYKTKESKMIDLGMEFAEIIIELKPDGTYTFTSDNEKVSSSHSGTWVISGDKIILNNGSETVDYQATSENGFMGKGSYELSYIK